jgi:lipopolysaccharide biosynthesis glycosyltransferase
MSAPLVLACAADDTFAMPMAAMLHSVFANLRSKGDVRLVVLENDIRPGKKERVERMVRAASPRIALTWVDVHDNIPKDVKLRKPISRTAYARLLLPELLPEHEKVIYLDSDLVVEADLGRLWNTALEDHTILAVQDFAVPYVSSDRGIDVYQELGLAPERAYFNSGVMVINLKRWRAERVVARVFAYQRAYREYMNYCDQEGLNAVLAGTWKELDPRWNQQAILFEDGGDGAFRETLCARRPELRSDPFIVHYSVSTKPWHALCEHPHQDRFLHHLKASQWFTPLGWGAWRSSQHALGWVRPADRWLREKSRPFRHRLRAALSE